MGLITIFLDIDGVLNTPSQFGKKTDNSNVRIFNTLIKKLSAKHQVQIVVSSSWRLSSGINRTLRDSGVEGKFKGITPNLGDRNTEINTYIKKNTLNPTLCIALDDEKDLVEKVICKYYVTNYKTGLIEKDIEKIVKLFN